MMPSPPVAVASAPCPNGTCPTSTPPPTRPRSPAISAGWRANAPPLPPITRASWPASTPPAMLDCIRRYERIETVAGRLMSYAGLRYYQNTLDADRAKFLADCRTEVTNVTTPLVFFSLEFNRIDDAAYKTPFCRHPRDCPLQAGVRPDARDEPVSALRRAGDASCTTSRWSAPRPGTGFSTRPWPGWNSPSWARTSPSASRRRSNLLTDHDRAAPRGRGARRWPQVFQRDCQLFARVHNTLAKEKEIEDRWRKMPDPQTGRHLANHVEPEVVEALRDAVVAAYPRLSPPLLRAEGEMAGPRQAAGLGPQRAAAERGRPQRSAGTRRATPCWAPMPASPRAMAEIAEPFFERGWIDAAVKPGKAPGAFAHPTVTEVHPYVLLNYLGKPRDVMTLAHELGHGVHQVLAAPQGETAGLDAADAGRDRERLRRDADLPPAAGRAQRTGGAQDAAGRQGRGHDQHRGPPDRLLRFRMQAARGPRRGRADTRRHQRALDERPGAKALALLSSSWRATRPSGPISRISSIRRSTSMPMPSATVW